MARIRILFAFVWCLMAQYVVNTGMCYSAVNILNEQLLNKKTNKTHTCRCTQFFMHGCFSFCLSLTQIYLPFKWRPSLNRKILLVLKQKKVKFGCSVYL